MTSDTFVNNYRAAVTQFVDAAALLRGLAFQFQVSGPKLEPANVGTENADLDPADVGAAVAALEALDKDATATGVWALLYRVKR